MCANNSEHVQRDFYSFCDRIIRITRTEMGKACIWFDLIYSSDKEMIYINNTFNENILFRMELFIVNSYEMKLGNQL